MTEPAPTQRKLGLLTRLTAGIGGLIAVAASTLLAVYETRAKPEIPVLAPGEPVTAGRWMVTIRSAALAGRTPDGLKMLNGKSALIVEADFENRTAATSNGYYDVLRLVGPPPGVDAKPMLYLKRDGALLAGLNPRMPEPVEAVWILPPGAAQLKTVALSVTAETYKAKDNLYAAPGWFNPHEVGRITLAVADRGAMP